MKSWLIASLCILIPSVLCHGLPHIVEESNPIFQQLKTYVETNVSSKLGQVALSIFIVSFPSIPVFFGLSFLGKLLKTKSDKHNFSDKLLNLLLAFACGTILGDVMLHILPFLFAQGKNKQHHDDHDHHDCQHHDEHDHGHDHDHHHEEGAHDHGDMKTPLMIIGGVVLFLFLDFLFMKLHSKHKHHGHNHGHKKEHKHKEVKSANQGKALEKEKAKKDKKTKVEDEKTVKEIAKEIAESEEKINEEEEVEEEEEHSAIPFLIGDFLHNITDGIAIGAAYNVSLQMGLMSTFVIMIHEMPHEIGDFASLIKYGYSLQKILGTQFLTSLGALVGGFIGLAGGSIYKTELLSVTAGGFMYMCLTQVIPEILQDLHKHHSIWHMIQIIVSIMLGVSLMYGVTLLE